MRQSKLYLLVLGIGCCSNMAFSETTDESGGWSSINKNVISDAGAIPDAGVGLKEGTFNFRTDRAFSTENTKEFKRDANGRYREHEVDRVNVGKYLNIKVEKPIIQRDQRYTNDLDSIGRLDAPRVDNRKIGLEIRR